MEPEVRPKVGPKVEPTSSRLQKAERNGMCIPKVRTNFSHPLDSTLSERSRALCPLWALCHNEREEKVSVFTGNREFSTFPIRLDNRKRSESFRSVSTKREISPLPFLSRFPLASKFSNSSVPLQLFRHVRPGRTFNGVHTSALFFLRNNRRGPKTPEKEREGGGVKVLQNF